MAGSYRHLLDMPDDGPGWSMIENMGDAAECVEELFWLVERAVGRKEALRLLEEEYYPMARREIQKDRAFTFVERQMGR